ncbi:MAG: ABC transporter ATP-binding protein [Anaerolineae bacterium]|nr:MAG: ABC transporter ATP-binding protein [Anaerolineae bacterium]
MTADPNALPLSIRNLTFRYRIREDAAIDAIHLDLHPGELMLVAGASGSGKTTLMRCINGLIPRSYRGELEGEILLYGEDMREMSMAQLSQKVGTLLQDPERQIVSSYVLNEVAFGLENLGLPREEILPRVDEALGYLNISHLRDRETFSLSGGEKQKIALAGVLVMRPSILILDEPLASLDPASAHEALHLFRRMADEGISIMLVEHRVDEVLAIQPDSVFYMEGGKTVYQGKPAGLMAVADYHKLKLPAEEVMQRARQTAAPVYAPVVGKDGRGETLLEFKHVSFRYDSDLPLVLYDISFNVNKGDIIGVLGPNGAGKSTLVKHALGLLKPSEGDVLLQGQSTRDKTVAQAAHTVGYVFQNPGQMLFAPTVQEELAFGPHNLRMDAETTAKNVDWAVNTVNMAEYRESPPLALSFGQQKRVSIAAILAMRSRILMMDEPTAGQDYWNYRAFMDAILQMPGFDAVIFITHDVDLAVVYANRVLLVSEGRLAADGRPQDVMADEALLRRCRVLPTSLLNLNLKHLPRTGRFMRAEQLAHAIG